MCGIICNELLVNNSWIGDVRLKFALRNGKSMLTTCRCVGPLCVQRGFYSIEDTVTPHVYLLHSSGGLVGGDQLILNVELDVGSRALLTTVDSSKFYRTNGLYALQKNTFKLSNNSILEWVPQSSIFFSNSKATIDNTFILEDGARVIAFEMLCFSNAMTDCDYIPEQLNVLLNIYLPNSVGLRERLQINKLNYVMKLGGFRISAIFFAIPSNEEMLHSVRALITKELVDNNTQVGGATLLETLLVVRLLGNDNQSLSHLLYQIWKFVRPIIVGKTVTTPRIWNM